jgi:hypothetical protein
MLEPEEVSAIRKRREKRNKKQKSVSASDAQYSIDYEGILQFV